MAGTKPNEVRRRKRFHARRMADRARLRELQGATAGKSENKPEPTKGQTTAGS